ncbi:unnamed protein product [Caenorhabditis angaria]|uniref:F-box domain-containing protein n=1 Tax=Caenorhabditis angaria TaxID=860376 RepID=A0A9P1MU93_9PELO|nr:unnamed protein product [Caenorhabditis angaria]
MKLEDDSEQTGWFDLPYEMRRIVIDLMDIQTKFRFSRCSKDCYEEVYLSKNAINEIEIRQQNNYGLCFILRNKNDKFFFVICKYGRENHFIYLEINKYLETGNILEDARICFDGLMKLARNSLQSLVIESPFVPINRTHLGQFKTLDNLVLDLPLNISSGFFSFEQICEVKEVLSINGLNFEQVFSLKAEIILMGDVEFTNQEFANFLNRIVEGDLNRGIRKISLNTGADKLDFLRSFLIGFRSELVCLIYWVFEKKIDENKFLSLVCRIEGDSLDKLSIDVEIGTSYFSL